MFSYPAISEESDSEPRKFPCKKQLWCSEIAAVGTTERWIRRPERRRPKETTSSDDMQSQLEKANLPGCRGAEKQRQEEEMLLSPLYRRLPQAAVTQNGSTSHWLLPFLVGRSAKNVQSVPLSSVLWPQSEIVKNRLDPFTTTVLCCRSEANKPASLEPGMLFSMILSICFRLR